MGIKLTVSHFRELTRSHERQTLRDHADCYNPGGDGFRLDLTAASDFLTSIGFDSAWENDFKAPGAICAVGIRAN